jgi:hypothetical protein
MNTPATPDFAALARELGLDAATYPIDQAFRHLGVKDSLGWKLVRQGALRAIRLTGRKSVVPAVDIARLLHERQQQPPRAQGERVRAGKAAARRTPCGVNNLLRVRASDSVRSDYVSSSGTP